MCTKTTVNGGKRLNSNFSVEDAVIQIGGEIDVSSHFLENTLSTVRLPKEVCTSQIEIDFVDVPGARYNCLTR